VNERNIYHLLVERELGQTELGHPLPVEPLAPEVPLLAMERWNITGGMLTKRYQFRHPGNRPRFVTAMMEYEDDTQHHAVLIVDEDSVIIKLVTKDVNRVTELDKEYARFADIVFKDLVYHPEG
jgi:pterin-4a-carbinolamine dehydratase